jgi:two-component system, LytTR family, response regulator
MNSAPLKAIVVDDEAASRNVLRDYVTRYCPHTEVTGEADSVQSALELIRNVQPDIVFLDVEMPHGNGFDLLEQVGDPTFDTIFVTAFDQYAIQAFNYSASYYLLKPVSIDELISAVDKVRASREAKHAIASSHALLEHIRSGASAPQKIVLPLIDGFEVARLSDVVCLEACDNFTRFHFTHKPKMMICRNLKFYETLLEDAGFLRVHKSHIINLDHVVKYTRGKGGVVILSDGTEVDVSPQKRDVFLRRFELGK